MNRNIKLGVVATLLAILTCSVAVALPSTLWQKRISQYESICVHEAYALITYKLNQTALVILDVRTRNEFNSGHIANAVNIPHTELEANLTNPSTCPLRGHENDLILVYCMAGSRAAIACEILAQDRTSGQVGKFTNVYDMVGGITEWTNPLWHYPIVYTQPATYVIISASEAYKMITNNTCKIFVDVRTQSEYNGEHIVNSTASPRTHAVNIPYNFDDTDFWNRASPTLAGHENEALILYCADNTCSKSLSACQCLIDHGFRKIYGIDDGIKAWKASGYPVWTVWTDVILNPSAEQGVARPDSWLQWTEPNALGEHIWSSDAHSGAKSLSLRLQAGSTGSRMWAQTFRTSLSEPTSRLTPGSTYSLSVFAKTVQGQAMLSVNFYDASSKWLDAVWKDNVRASNWTSFSLSVAIPMNAAWFSISACLLPSGIDAGQPFAQCWFDDFDLPT